MMCSDWCLTNTMPKLHESHLSLGTAGHQLSVYGTPVTSQNVLNSSTAHLYQQMVPSYTWQGLAWASMGLLLSLAAYTLSSPACLVPGYDISSICLPPIVLALLLLNVKEMNHHHHHHDEALRALLAQPLQLPLQLNAYFRVTHGKLPQLPLVDPFTADHRNTLYTFS
eukprot:GHUV01036142.1.p1 GENE.GHUV01036142.1~~GHUV01036142.1.p1  ORF type:complete len:168 (-),score=23.89 GHUV01036142.1:362-865(-)